MPARTVVFDELRKFYGRFYAALRTRDFYQMAGRAGRRGIDEEGFVYSRVNLKYTTPEELKRIIFSQPEKVKSRFNASYATVLTLYEKYGEGLYDIYPRSFHYYQQKEKYRRRALELLEAKVSILKDMGYISDGAITAKGGFAAKVYGYELPLAELYSQGMLDELSEVELGVICLSLVFEPRKNTGRPVLSKRARALNRTTDSLINRIHHAEQKFKIKPLSKICHFHLSPPLEAWMRGDDFDRTLRMTDADEGGVIRYFRMATQILREILDTDAPEGLKEKVRGAVKMINRGIIDAKNQLEISDEIIL
jgi:superfamily II RNA helicase